MRIDREILKELGRQVQLDQLGATAAAPLDKMKDILAKRIRDGRVTTFEENDPDLRLSADHLLPGCRTIVTLAVPYDRPAEVPSYKPEGPKGLVSRCARGQDYHRVVERKATQLLDLLEQTAKQTLSNKILTDRSPLIERELARRSGLGLIGENCTLINPLYGSYVVLGTILLDIAIEPDQPNKETCLKCGKCRQACPTEALKEPYVLDPRRCLSYLSQVSGVFPADLRASLGSRLYGCDSCQEACPLNQKVATSPLAEFGGELFAAEPDLFLLLKISRREFDETIGLTSAGWRGKTTLQRNAVIALGNSKNQDAVKTLARILENDTRPLIRLHAAWALGLIGGRKANFSLGKSAARDPEESVRREALTALGEVT